MRGLPQVNYLALLIALSAVTYRIGRFVILDTLIDEPRNWVMGWLERHPHKFWEKILDLLGCPFCITIWISAAVVAITDLVDISVPMPVWTWLGTGPTNAAVAQGWSPAKLRRMQKDPETAELIAVAQERRLETYEETLHQMAVAGHFKALQMILFNQRSQHWKDVRHIQMTANTQLDVGVVVSVKQSVAELIRENGVAALQSGGALDVLDVVSHDVTDG